MNMVFIFYTSYKVQMNITKFMGKYLIYTIAFEDIRIKMPLDWCVSLIPDFISQSNQKSYLDEKLLSG